MRIRRWCLPRCARGTAARRRQHCGRSQVPQAGAACLGERHRRGSGGRRARALATRRGHFARRRPRSTPASRGRMQTRAPHATRTSVRSRRHSTRRGPPPRLRRPRAPCGTRAAPWWRCAGGGRGWGLSGVKERALVGSGGEPAQACAVRVQGHGGLPRYILAYLSNLSRAAALSAELRVLHESRDVLFQEVLCAALQVAHPLAEAV